MNVGQSVRKAINDWTQGDLEAAMLHACNAIDGTAKKLYPKLSTRDRFTHLLRANYGILGPMGAPGVNCHESKFPVKLPNHEAENFLDLADIVYLVHRCTHSHGDELPDGFELLSDVAGPPRVTRLRFNHGRLQLSDRIIFGLLAVAVTSPVNIGQSVPGGYVLTYGAVAVMPWGASTRSRRDLVLVDKPAETISPSMSGTLSSTATGAAVSGARSCSARCGLRAHPRALRRAAAAATGAAQGRLDQQARHRGACSLNTSDDRLIRLDRFRFLCSGDRSSCLDTRM